MSLPASSVQRVALIGAGRVGTAVAHLLAESGVAVVGVASRTEISARRAGDLLGAPVFGYETDLPAADVYLIGATDLGIAEIAGSLAGRVAPGATLVHLSGALGVEVLRPALAKGVEGAALHPVQSCPDVATAIRRLPGSVWGVTCTPGAVAPSEFLIATLEGKPVAVAEDKRALWHAASVMTSNGISALLGAGEALAEEASGFPGIEVLSPLALGSLQNALEGGGGAATLTGPIVRGEFAAIGAHLEAIDRDAPDLRSAYVAVAKAIAEVAARAGRLDEAGRARLLEVLG